MVAAAVEQSTPAIARRDYFQTDVKLLKIESKRWFAQAVYSYISSRGTTQYSLSGNLSNPSQVELNYGALDSDINHQLKLAAFWNVPDDPWTTELGMSGVFYSGSPISRYYWSAADLSSGVGDYQLLKEQIGRAHV